MSREAAENAIAPQERWGAVSQLFHWACATLVVSLGALGLYMTGVSSPVAKIRLYALHKSAGLTLLALVLLRLAWRLGRRAPLPVPGTPLHLHRAAGGVHVSLYLMMIAMPVTGWLVNSSAGYPLQWFRLVNLPAIAHKDPALNATATLLHQSGFWLLAALVAGHVLAALYHHLFLGDGTLHRMLPWRLRPSSRNPPP